MAIRIRTRPTRHGLPWWVAVLILTGVILTISQIGATSAAAHGGGESPAELSTSAAIARALALSAAALLAGAALIRPLAGYPTEAARGLTLAIGLLGALSAAAGALGSLSGPRYLSLIPLLMLTAHAAMTGPGRLSAQAGALTVVWLCWSALSDSTGAALLMLAHVTVAVVWVGAVLAVATAEPASRAALVGRLRPIALGVGALAAVTGVLSARNYHVRLDGITLTDFGVLVVLKATLAVAAGALGLASARRLRVRRDPVVSRRGGVPARFELGVLVLAILAGAVLTSLPEPGPPPVAGAPLVRALLLGDASTPLVVAPQLPGRNLVHLSTDRHTELVVADRRYRAEPRPGAQGQWAEVWLPPGRSLLELRRGRQVAIQILDAGAGPAQGGLPGPDGMECAAAALGAALAGSKAPVLACPAQSLRADEVAALRAQVEILASRGVRRLALITDTSPRGLAAQSTVHAAARAGGISVRGPEAAGRRAQAVLAVAGWQVSQVALELLKARPAPLHGTYLAPWLVQSSLVRAAGGAPLAVFPFDPAGPQGQAYVISLRRFAPDQSASTAGFYAYLTALGRPVSSRKPLLYVATGGFDVMGIGLGGGSGMDHRGGDVSWLGEGPLTPVSTPPAGQRPLENRR
ncbi:MAG: hypothetical protein ACT4PP_14590 [Sporichthyaceae bacterium]